jgi:hypothetical protein
MANAESVLHRAAAWPVLCKTTPEFWVNLQAPYALDKAKREKLAEIQAEVNAGDRHSQPLYFFKPTVSFRKAAISKILSKGACQCAIIRPFGLFHLMSYVDVDSEGHIAPGELVSLADHPCSARLEGV